MPSKKIWEFPENIDPQPSMVFLVDENFITQKISLSGLTNSTYFSKFLSPITSGSYDGNTGCITFTTNSGGTINVCGFNSGGVSAFTYDNKNNLTIIRNGLSDLTINLSELSGLTVSGNIKATGVISGGTLYGDATNLTGIVNSGSYNNNTKLITFFRNDGPTAFTVNLSSLDINDTYVTGGTLTQPTNNTHDGSINLTYNQDVPTNVYKLPYTDTFVTGFSYNNSNTFTIFDNDNKKFSATINTVTGLTINGNLNINGNTNQIGNFNLTGNTNQIGNFNLTGNTNQIGNFNLTGNTNQIGNFNLTGNTNILGNTILNGNLNVNGNTTLSGVTNQIGNFNLTGSTTFNGNFTIQNANGTNTGINVFDTSLIPAGQVVVHQFQAEGGIIAHLGDLASGEPNSKGYLYMQDNNIPTPCASRLVYYKISGVTTTIGEYLNLFTTGNTYNKLVYNYPPATGSSVTYLKYNISISLSVNGGSRPVNVQLRKNNMPVPINMTITSAGTGQPVSNNLSGIVAASNNDFFEVFVNIPNSDVETVVVSDLSLSLFT